MKNNIFKLRSVKKCVVCTAFALMLTCSFSALVGCQGGGDESSSSSPSDSSVEITYTLSFETNGGAAMQAVKVKEGETVDLSNYVPTKENGYFYGWCLDETLQTRADSVITVSADTKLYAEWGAEEQYLLSFETGKGTKIESVLYRPNAYLSAPTEPTRENYAFAGWYKDAACTQEFSFLGAQMPKKALTVYAKWTSLCGIVFETNGGTPVQSVYGAAGDPIDANVTPTKAGFVFEGWYTDAALKTPYEVSIIPNKVLTVYAKWHEQIKNIQVTLHVNYAGQTKTLSVTGNEGETLNAKTAIDEFTADVNESLKESYLGNESALKDKPIYKLSAWAYDAAGSQRFGGALPNETVLDLYAVWSRSAAYCQVTFVEDDKESTYFVDKNSVIEPEILETHVASAKQTYEALGCEVEGFYTLGGNRYGAGQTVAMDMRLMPYVYSADLEYEYVTKKSASGSQVKGYALKGYAKAEAQKYKEKDELLLLIPEYYKGESVIWINDNAFADFNVSSVTMPKSVLGIGAQAFKNTKLESIELPSNLYCIGDNAFSESASLRTVVFNGPLSQIGATIFKNTAYETTMPQTNGFIFFDSQRTLIYSYVGTDAEPKMPATARTIGGGAFKGNTTITKLTMSDGIRFISDYAFEGCKLQSVTFGKFFADMGVGIFKDCTSLVSVNFASEYNLATLGVSMFEGCTALKTIDVSKLANLSETKEKAFKGCSSLQTMTFGDNFVTLGTSTFENCTSLVSVDFGTSDASKLATIQNRAFAGCTSLKRVILRGNLINNQIVSFKSGVFTNAGYTKNGVFVTPVLYVKNNTVDNWRGDDEQQQIYTYTEIYKMRLPSEYRNIVVKAIDSKIPEVSVFGNVELTSSQALAQFDLLAYLQSENVYAFADDVSKNTDCLVYIANVVRNGTQQVVAQNGKYDLRAVGTYTVVLAVEDEFGNKAEAVISVIVKNA